MSSFEDIKLHTVVPAEHSRFGSPELQAMIVQRANSATPTQPPAGELQDTLSGFQLEFPVLHDNEVFSSLLDQVQGAHGAAVQSAYCPSSEPFKAAQKRFYASVENLRATLTIATSQPAPVADFTQQYTDGYTVGHAQGWNKGRAAGIEEAAKLADDNGYGLIANRIRALNRTGAA